MPWRNCQELSGEMQAPAQAVVGGVGLVEERMLAAGPVEAAGVDHDAADAGAVAAEPLGEGMNDDVRTVRQRVGEVGGREGGVDHEGDPEGLGMGPDRVEVRDLQGRV